MFSFINKLTNRQDTEQCFRNAIRCASNIFTLWVTGVWKTISHPMRILCYILDKVREMNQLQEEKDDANTLKPNWKDERFWTK